MLAVVSPAKKLDFESDIADLATTEPRFKDLNAELSETTKKLSRSDLIQLMGISEALADLNYQRFQVQGTDASSKRAAALAFKGDTYVGLQVETFSPEDMAFAQDHLRILSGFYGMLRPLDAMEPYRLEMGIKLATPRAKDLYGFWDSVIADALNEELAEHQNGVLINLASNEYFKAVQKKVLKAPIITPNFKQDKGGVLKSLGMMSKRARGAMARFMILNRIEKPEDLKDFNLDGYGYRPDLSTETEWMFVKQG